MMKLACKDISPKTTCTFEVQAETANAAGKMMLAHARVAHVDDIKNMSDEEAIKAFETKAHA